LYSENFGGTLDKTFTTMSRAARLTLSATAWIALGAAAFFLITTEQKVADRRSALRLFDRHAREAAVALGDARAAQQAYVAAGQSSSYWIPKSRRLSRRSEITSRCCADRP
jgi:hypothetical protein